MDAFIITACRREPCPAQFWLRFTNLDRPIILEEAGEAHPWPHSLFPFHVFHWIAVPLRRGQSEQGYLSHAFLSAWVFKTLSAPSETNRNQVYLVNTSLVVYLMLKGCCLVSLLIKENGSKRNAPWEERGSSYMISWLPSQHVCKKLLLRLFMDQEMHGTLISNGIFYGIFACNMYTILYFE